METKLIRLKDRRTSDVLYFPIVESLAMGYLASSLRQNGFNVEIMDEEVQDLSRNKVIKKLNSADLIGFTATAKPQIFEIIDVVKELRKTNKKVHITVGGHFATFMYKELLNFKNIFDSVVLYEGEETMIELAETLSNGKSLDKIEGIAYKNHKNKIIKSNLRPLIKDLDTLSFPTRDLLPEIIRKGGLTVISSSRGCYNRCSYCTISQFYNDPKGIPFRVRSAENVIRELKELKKNYSKLKDIWFVDDNFVFSGERAFERTRKICGAIKSLGIRFDIYLRANDVSEKLLKLLKESGIRSIFIGAESGCENTLRNILNKNVSVENTKKAILLCKKFEINVDPGFIMFHPWSTLDEIEKNINFLKEIDNYTPYGINSFLTTYKFTPIGKDMLSGKKKYKKQRIKRKEFLQDDVPYEIVDIKAELLLDLTLKSFQNFKELPKALFELKRFSRITNNKRIAKIYSHKIRCFSRLAMKYFEELFLYLKKHSLEDKDLIKFFNRVCEDIKRDTEKQVAEVYSLIEKVKE